MVTLPTTLDLVRRVVAVEAAYTIARMRVLERLPDNPIGIAFRTEGHVQASMARHMPVPAFNAVTGLRRGDAAVLPRLDAWYREAGVAGRFVIAAPEHDADVARTLARLGYVQSGVHAALVREPRVADASVASDVEPIASAEAMEAFLDAYVLGWGLPPDTHDGFKRNVRAWWREPGWSLYVARWEGRPAATGIAFARDGLTYLADGATDPAARGRGLHTTLVARRIADAGEAIVCGGADLLSTSYRTLERAGLRLLFTRLIWTRLD